MAFVAIAVPSDVTSRAKEFASLDVSEIQAALDDATAQVNVTVFGGASNHNALLAQVYLAAHFLSLSNPKLATAAGPVSGEKVGDVSANYAVSAFKGSQGYNATRWGQAFVTLARKQAAATLIVINADGPLPIPCPNLHGN